MQSADAKTKIGHTLLTALPVNEPWVAFVLPVDTFPISDERLPSIQQFLKRFSTAVCNEWRLSTQVFLQLFCLRRGGGSDVVSSHGRQWMPKLGLGVWPDRPAPTFWTKEDFEKLGPGEKPRTLMYQVMQITKSEDARREACDLMHGRGSTIQILTPDSGDMILDKARQVLLPPIKDPSFTCFPFYIPLLDRKSLETASADQLEHWSCGASVYIRESVEDSGILLLSRHVLRPILERMGGTTADDGSAWHIPN